MLTWYDDIFITQLKVVFNSSDHWSKNRLTGIQTINQDKLIWGDNFAEFNFSPFSLAFRSIWNDPRIWPNIMRLYLGAFRACSICYPSALLDFSLFLWFFPCLHVPAPSYSFLCVSRIKILLFTFIWSFELVSQLRMYERNWRQILVIACMPAFETDAIIP